MEEAGFEKAVTAGGLLHVLELAVEVAPALSAAPVVETWSNFRPATPDGLPILGAAATPGLFHATGHYRNGVLLAPITADAVAVAVLSWPGPVDLSPFAASRLAPRGPAR
jgi:glycine oxidase